MRLNAPKKATWWISLILAILGVLGALIAIPVLTPLAFWLVLVAFILLLLGSSVKGF
jgi:hypothetical protein